MCDQHKASLVLLGLWAITISLAITTIRYCAGI